MELQRLQPAKSFQMDPFLYAGKNHLAYKKCESIPSISLKMWMSCCDESCTGRGGEEPSEAAASRRRRSHHLYRDTASQSGQSLSNSVSPGCKHRGVSYADGHRWSEGECNTCECRVSMLECNIACRLKLIKLYSSQQAGSVWCKFEHGCDAERSQVP
jgi:hypothetical protein